VPRKHEKVRGCPHAALQGISLITKFFNVNFHFFLKTNLMQHSTFICLLNIYFEMLRVASTTM